MKLILFLGAGVSLPSELSLASELMHEILHGSYHQEGPHNYAPGPGTDPALRAKDLTPRIRRFLKAVMEHDELDIKRVGYHKVGGGFKSSGAIYRGGSTYEDIYFLCQQVSLWNIGLSDNSLPELRKMGLVLEAQRHDCEATGSAAWAWKAKQPVLPEPFPKKEQPTAGQQSVSHALW